MIDLLIYLVRMIGCQLLIWNCLLQSICHCFQFQEGGFSFTFTFLGLIAAINCLFNHLILYFVIVKLLSIINYSTRYLYSPYDYQFTNSIIQHTPKTAWSIPMPGVLTSATKYWSRRFFNYFMSNSKYDSPNPSFHDTNHSVSNPNYSSLIYVCFLAFQFELFEWFRCF